MERSIFIKYSNERNRKFAIKTEITEDESGNHSVKKTALYPEGLAHIKSFTDKYTDLAKIYDHSILICNRCEVDVDSAKFEYIKAETLEEKLDTLLNKNKMKEAEQVLRNYLMLIEGMNNSQEFHMTDGFREVFGDVSLPEGLRCASVSDIDMVCSNIMVRDKYLTVIDYEWTFAFPVPAHYLLYRIIHYYLDTNNSRARLKETKWYSLTDISEQEQNAYAAMEKKFQNYITQGHVPMREMYASISPGMYEVSHLISKEQTKRNQGVVQVFFSYGEGFLQENSRYYRMTDGYINLELDLPEKIDEIRIDPGEGTGICKILCLNYDVGAIQKLNVSEGIEVHKNILLMSKMDPQIYLGKVPKEAKKLQIELKTMITDAENLGIGEAYNSYIHSLKSLNSSERQDCLRMKETNEQLSRKIQEMEEDLVVTKNKISNMEKTKIWKAYRKYRDVLERNQ